MDSERWSNLLRKGFRILSPTDGETVTDPLVVSGQAPWHLLERLPLVRASGRSNGSDPDRSPELLVDGEPVERLGRAVVERGRFALKVSLPELGEGEHVLSLRGARTGTEWGRRTIRVRRPAAAPGAQRVGRSALVRLLLAEPSRRPRVLIDCRDWDWVSWLVERNGQGWYGAALLDLQALPVGHHHLVIQAEGHPRVDLDVERLSEFG